MLREPSHLAAPTFLASVASLARAVGAWRRSSWTSGRASLARPVYAVVGHGGARWQGWWAGAYSGGASLYIAVEQASKQRWRWRWPFVFWISPRCRGSGAESRVRQLSSRLPPCLGSKHRCLRASYCLLTARWGVATTACSSCVPWRTQRPPSGTYSYPPIPSSLLSELEKCCCVMDCLVELNLQMHMTTERLRFAHSTQ